MQSRNITNGPPGSRQVLTIDTSVLVLVQYIHNDGVYIMSCYISVCVCASEFLNTAQILLFLYGRSFRGNQGAWGECVCDISIFL